MSFFWPRMLWLLLIVPTLTAAYVLAQRRRQKYALRYASLSLVKEALGKGPGFRRHIPAILFLAAMTVVITALARPAAVVVLPSQQGTIILTLDSSGSMRADDVKPSRIEAAKAAAKAFVAKQPKNQRVGVVAFAATATLVQPPTRDREAINAAIDRLTLQRGTAIGSGIILSLATIFPDAGIDVSDSIYGRDARRSRPLDPGREPEKKEFIPVPPGSYSSAAIVLLTDGQRTTGPDSLEAARMAADRGVRVFTVGVGTTKGEVIGFEGWSFHARLDEDTLKAIADRTRGEYFHAGTAMDLKKIYEGLSARLVFEKQHTEITALFAAAAACIALAAALLSLLWFGRIL